MFSSGRFFEPWAIHQRDRWFVPSRAVGSYFVIVSATARQAIAMQSTERGQSSIFVRASSRFMNQCVFRHSARNLPLKLSMNAFAIVTRTNGVTWLIRLAVLAARSPA